VFIFRIVGNPAEKKDSGVREHSSSMAVRKASLRWHSRPRCASGQRWKLVSDPGAASGRVRFTKVRNADAGLSVCRTAEQGQVSALFHWGGSPPRPECALVKSMAEPMVRTSFFVLKYHLSLYLTASFQ